MLNKYKDVLSRNDSKVNTTHTHITTYINTHTHTHTHLYIYIYIWYFQKVCWRKLTMNEALFSFYQLLVALSEYKLTRRLGNSHLFIWVHFIIQSPRVTLVSASCRHLCSCLLSSVSIPRCSKLFSVWTRNDNATTFWSLHFDQYSQWTKLRIWEQEWSFNRLDYGFLTKWPTYFWL